jgi:tryptophan-rich sensory protein
VKCYFASVNYVYQQHDEVKYRILWMFIYIFIVIYNFIYSPLFRLVKQLCREVRGGNILVVKELLSHPDIDTTINE